MKRALDDQLAAVNPLLLVEVTSSSTEAWDRGGKADRYARLETLRELVLVSLRERAIELRRREADGSWSVHHARTGQALELNSIGARLSVDSVNGDLLA